MKLKSKIAAVSISEMSRALTNISTFAKTVKPDSLEKAAAMLAVISMISDAALTKAEDAPSAGT